ncbi:MAG: HD domain-containing protein [Leptolinea sp.]|nr:HD domain-containing protein [Leptolinea sp.]
MPSANSGGDPTQKATGSAVSDRSARNLINSLPAALFVVDRNCRIKDLNLTAVTLCRADSASIVLGKSLESLITPTPDGGKTVKDLLKEPGPVMFRAILNRSDKSKLTVQVISTPPETEVDELIVLMAEIPMEARKTAELITAYEKQRILNQRLGEVLDLGRTFSRYTELDRVLDRVVKVVGESLGYGFVGLYLKDSDTSFMRVATYINKEIDITQLEDENQGKAWDLLMLVNQNIKELKKVGASRLSVKFGMDADGAGQTNTTEAQPGGTIWKMGDSLIALIQPEGTEASGYLKASHPLKNNSQKQSDPLFENTESFRRQAVWVYSTQASIAIENAILLGRARKDIDEHTRAEKNLVLSKEDLEKRILDRTHELEKLNKELHSEIMDREVAQRERDQQTMFLRQVLDTNPSLIYARDRNGRYTLINEAAARFENLTIEDIVGKTDKELNHDVAQVIRWRHEDLDVIDNKREMILPEERIIDTKGREHYLQTIKRPIFGPDGKIEQVLGVSIEITDRKKAEERVVQANAELAQAYDATIEGWSRALDLRDRETEGHSLRVTNMTLRLAAQIGIERSEFLHLRRGALLHDIGKMGIPDEILFKKGALNAEEWVIMRKHPTYAYNMLSPIEYLHPALVIPRYHHEKWDGTGYPEKLEGEMIPLPARIFAVVDVWDALTSDRPYRAAWDPKDVKVYIEKNSGSHFDPKVIKVFLKNLDDIVNHFSPDSL